MIKQVIIHKDCVACRPYESRQAMHSRVAFATGEGPALAPHAND